MKKFASLLTINGLVPTYGFNPKIQAFKHALDLTRSIRAAEGARQFNSFNNFSILAIYCGIHTTSKTCEM